MCHKSRARPTAHKGGRKAWQSVPLTWANGKAGFTGPGWLIQLRVASRYSLLSVQITTSTVCYSVVKCDECNFTKDVLISRVE